MLIFFNYDKIYKYKLMSYFSLLLLSIALSVDACAVAFSFGLAFKERRIYNSFLLSVFTGVFQGLMPCFGYILADLIKLYILPFSNIIIFLIFTFLGLKFIKEAFDSESPKPVCIDLKCLILIGIATSIDAFSAGITLSLSGNKIFLPALLIAFVTFINTMIGFWAGANLKHVPSKYLEIMAGVILLSLGLKTFM